MNRDALLAFAPALAYLGVVCVLLLSVRRCPAWVHLAVLPIGIAARVLVDGWADPLTAAGLAGIVFVLGVFLTSRLLTGVSLFTLCTTLTLLPTLHGWIGLGIGLAVAAVVSVWRTVRSLGVARVHLLTYETMAAAGIAPGEVGRPDLDRLPTRADAEAALVGTPAARPMWLPPYLLLGVAAAAAFFALT